MPHRVTASIRPDRLEGVVEALNDVGIHEFVVAEVRGYTRHVARGTYRGAPFAALAQRVLVDVVVPGRIAEMVGELISQNARTGGESDGTVWLAPLHGALDVATGTYHRDEP